MNRLIDKTVFCGLVTACRFATCPTSRSPSLVNATTDGVVRPPSAFGMTTGSPPSMTATTELVVPRSMPMIFEAIGNPFLKRRQTSRTMGPVGQRFQRHLVSGQVAYPVFVPFWQDRGSLGPA